MKIKSRGEKIGLTNYSDLVVFDKTNNIVALRIGGYPESVQAMSDIIRAGCDLELYGPMGKLELNSKGKRKIERRLSHDGIYAEGMHYIKDDVPNTIMLGEGEEDDAKVALKKNLYFFCKDDDELYADIDRKLSVPLIPEFKEYFLCELKSRGLLNPLRVYTLGKEFYGWHMEISADEKEIANVLKYGIKTGNITIPGGKGNSDVFNNIESFTQYLKEFGNMVADKITECFPPRFNPAEESVSDRIIEVKEHVRSNAGYSLFDAQLGAAEALKRQLETDKMALLVAECGTGKTKIGSMALYSSIADVIRTLTENPLGDKLNELTAKVIDARDEFEGNTDKTRALFVFRQELVQIYDDIEKLKNDIVENDPALAAINGTVETIENVSRDVHSKTNFTYVSMEEIKALGK